MSQNSSRSSGLRKKTLRLRLRLIRYNPVTKGRTQRARRSVLVLATDKDALAFSDHELYWLPSGGMSDSDLDLKAIWQVLGTNTIRTKGTVDQMAAKFFAE